MENKNNLGNSLGLPTSPQQNSIENKKIENKKVFVLGIDGAMPDKIFGEWLDELPNIKKLMNQGCYAKLNSSIPPLSAVAWLSMMTGKPPAEHGIFEYIYRKGNSYDFDNLINSHCVEEKTIWNILGEQGKKSAICFAPLTWPPKPINGNLITGFLTPLREDVEFTYPKELKQEINSLFDEPLLMNIKDFRNLSKEDSFKRGLKLTEMYFDSMKYVLKNKKWDFFFGLMNMSDRMNHCFWKFCDKKHRDYKPNSPYENVLKDYYKFVDKQIGELINLLDENTQIIIVSDHGITRLHTRVNLSDWLIKEGYLVLKEDVKITEPCRLEINMIDWKKTKVFVIGAYEAQLYINLKGREPFGIVEQEEYGFLIKELKEKLKNIPGDNGWKLNTKIFKKKDFVGKNQHLAPDMIVYFDNLEYGCNSTRIGNQTLWSPQTAMGSDDAGHSRQGIFIQNQSLNKGDIKEIDILDIAPTILNKLNLEVPKGLKGKIIN